MKFHKAAANKMRRECTQISNLSRFCPPARRLAQLFNYNPSCSLYFSFVLRFTHPA
ncbi:hypothetical protein CAMGR0001_1876 [Campylobacter gracilis RM3268]|uniref:Uncharacterized protein n=1 Tax=Campylobacter gracilis RM3268 TaxID=553220 RepID=C8PEH5_9BACT|nr:hypothetical protein CAMGR0001_1876 [Campylobacter gracilis RM3268]